MAIREGMIGITTTNARPAVPPTFGVEPMLGTNPITAGAPTNEDFPFLIDCATSIIQRGTVEVYNRMKKPLPSGLVITSNGKTENNPEKVLGDLENNRAALLPLGGEDHITSGYKGYGYATFVEVLSSALQNGVFLKDTAGIIEENQKRLKVGHFFLAMNIESFIPLELFKETAGTIMKQLRDSKKAPGKDQIYTAGEKEHYSEIERREIGIPINKSLQKDIILMKEELNLNKYDFNF
jgi:LDH2 family malate/lactate/ureidoglycolate dehydrogenase